MYPSLFKISNISISSYTLLLIISFIITIFGAIQLAKRENITMKDVTDLCVLCFIFGLIFARVASIIIHYEDFIGKPKIFTTGLSFHGGLIGCVVAIIFYAIRSKISFYKLIDLLIPFGALSYAIGRIGCYLAGCCWGTETNTLWSVVFPLSRLHTEYVSVHPVQLYDSFLNFVLFLFLLEYRNHEQRIRSNGQLFLLFLIGNSLIRFFVEYFRWSVSTEVLFNFITAAQIVCILIITASIIIIRRLSKYVA